MEGQPNNALLVPLANNACIPLLNMWCIHWVGIQLLFWLCGGNRNGLEWVDALSHLKWKYTLAVFELKQCYTRIWATTQEHKLCTQVQEVLTVPLCKAGLPTISPNSHLTQFPFHRFPTSPSSHLAEFPPRRIPFSPYSHFAGCGVFITTSSGGANQVSGFQFLD